MARAPRILAAICLNEEAFIGSWLEYHYEAFDRIILCEGAARDYPRPTVTADGLSADRTAAVIRAFPDPQAKLTFVQHGWAGPPHNPDDSIPAKIGLRNAYAALIDDGYVFTLDVDEFLHPTHVAELIDVMEEHPDVHACAIPQLHLWQATSQYITGGYADVPHVRLYRWPRGARYVVSHNWPSAPGGRSLAESYLRMPLEVEGDVLTAPAILHFGFCEPKESMLAKNYYYVMRGEYRSRPLTTEFRAAAFGGWTPEGCAVHPYRGFLPQATGHDALAPDAHHPKVEAVRRSGESIGDSAGAAWHPGAPRAGARR
jgi:Glycosyl transferase family 2